MIFERHTNLKYKYGNRHFWCRGYYVDTVGKNAKRSKSISRTNKRGSGIQLNDTKREYKPVYG